MLTSRQEQFTEEWDFVPGAPSQHGPRGEGTAGNYHWWTNIYQVGLVSDVTQASSSWIAQQTLNPDSQVMWSLITLCRNEYPPEVGRYAAMEVNGSPIYSWSYGLWLLDPSFQDVDLELRELVVRCLDHKPLTRPKMETLREVFQRRVRGSASSEEDQEIQRISREIFGDPPPPPTMAPPSFESVVASARAPDSSPSPLAPTVRPPQPPAASTPVAQPPLPPMGPFYASSAEESSRPNPYLFKPLPKPPPLVPPSTGPWQGTSSTRQSGPPASFSAPVAPQLIPKKPVPAPQTTSSRQGVALRPSFPRPTAPVAPQLVPRKPVPAPQTTTARQGGAPPPSFPSSAAPQHIPRKPVPPLRTYRAYVPPTSSPSEQGRTAPPTSSLPAVTQAPAPPQVPMRPGTPIPLAPAQTQLPMGSVPRPGIPIPQQGVARPSSVPTPAAPQNIPRKPVPPTPTYRAYVPPPTQPPPPPLQNPASARPPTRQERIFDEDDVMMETPRDEQPPSRGRMG